MKNLARRLESVERRMQSRIAPEPIEHPRRAWPVRFARYSPANAELLDRIRAWLAIRAPAYLNPELRWMDAWQMTGALALLAGYDMHGDRLGLPAEPTAEEREAFALVEELTEGIGRYQEVTGDVFPLIQNFLGPTPGG